MVIRVLYVYLIQQTTTDMKTYTIKNYSGQKTLIINTLTKADVKELYKVAVSKSIPFAVKQDIGIQIWGLSKVASYLGVKDSSKLLND